MNKQFFQDRIAEIKDLLKYAKADKTDRYTIELMEQDVIELEEMKANADD